MKTKAKPSGSEKLNAQGAAFSPIRVRRLLALLKRHKLDRGIIINGTPKPDFIQGKLSAPSPGAAGAILTEFLKLGGTYEPVRLFPKGQPPIIDKIDMDFSVHA